MSSGFYERLSAISSDPSSPDGMTDLVVAALGSFGRYYICWKTRSGEYKQESSGLPDPLQEWLFPTSASDSPNGHPTRDFATLQVVLGHGDDFFAADRDGKIERKASPSTSSASSPPDRGSPSPQPGDRHSFPRSLRRSNSGGGSSNSAAAQAARRRSRTLSLVGPPAGFRLSQQPQTTAVSPISELSAAAAPAADRRRRLSGEDGSSALRAAAATPTPAPTATPRPLTLARRNMDWSRRPKSIAFGEGDMLRVPEGGFRGATRSELLQHQQQQVLVAPAPPPRGGGGGGRARGVSTPSPPPLPLVVVEKSDGVGGGGGGGERAAGGGGGGVGGGQACCQCGCHAAVPQPAVVAQPIRSPPVVVRDTQRPPYATAGTQASIELPVPAPPPRPKYVDSSMQTDAPPAPPPQQQQQQSRGRRSVVSSSSSVSYSSHSSFSSSSSSYPSSYSSSSSSYDFDADCSRRSSAALTDITSQSTYECAPPPPAPAANPVMMGKMQDYFRSGRYQLGDALRPAQYSMGYSGGYMGFNAGWSRSWGGNGGGEVADEEEYEDEDEYGEA